LRDLNVLTHTRQELAEHVDGIAGVVDDQNAARPQLAEVNGAGGQCGYRSGHDSDVGNERQVDDEFAAFAGAFAEDVDLAAVHLDEALGERQSDAESSLCMLEPSIQLWTHI